MKKLLFLFSILVINTSTIAQTATDFTVNDCDGVSHNLFEELDAGNVVVIAWVMPCGPCIGPTTTAYASILNNFSDENINFYVVDDYANTSCSSLSSWVQSNGMQDVATFSDASITMSDYGTNGMPKIVILGGGSSHKVYFNENSSTVGFDTAMELALSESGMSISDIEAPLLNVYPNPAQSFVTIENLHAEQMTIDIFDLKGQMIMQCSIPAMTNKQVNVAEFSEGVYYIKSKGTIQSKFIIK